MKNIFIAGLAAALMIVLAACGGSSGGPNPDPDPNNDVLDRETAEAFADDAVFAVNWQLQALQDPLAILPLGTLSLSSEGLSVQQEDCVTVTGSNADADSDGIPVDLTTSYNCRQLAEGYTFVMTGSITIKDQNDTDPNSGFSMLIDNFEYELSGGGETISANIDGSLALSISGNTYGLDVDMVYDVKAEGESYNLDYDFEQTYVADNLSNPFASGVLSFSGSIQSSHNGETFSLSMQSNPSLRLDATCATGVASGAASFTDGSNTVNVSYACDTYTVTYNGSPL